MKTTGKRFGAGKGWRLGAKIGTVAALSAVLLGGCGRIMTLLHGNIKPPAESEFGLGPRVSSGGLYQASIEPGEPLRTRRMQTVKLLVRTAEQAPVEGASIAVDGGMPQHGHGLPTKPRVTRALGDGTYEVEGLKFNMGGWWVVKFRIDSAAGTDSVTFNLAL
jgi:hypothetical protein